MSPVGFVAFGKDGKPYRPAQRRNTSREESKPLVCYTSERIARQATKQDDIRPVYTQEPTL